MLWWEPPTSVTPVLIVEKSKNRHAHHTLEITLLRSTCILGKNTLPTRTVREFWVYAATVDFPSPEKPKKWGDQKSPKMTDWIIHGNVFSYSCCGTRMSDAPWQTAGSSAVWVIQSAAVWPRWPVRRTRLFCSVESRARLLRQGKSAQTLCLTNLTRREQRVEVQGNRGDHQTMQRTRARLLLLSDATSLLSLFLSLLPLSPSLSHFLSSSQDLRIGYWGCCYCCCCWITPYWPASLTLSPPVMGFNTGL